MNRIGRFAALATMSAVLFTGGMFAQDHYDDQGYVRHDEWKKGAKINQDDWKRAQPVDYHEHHLKAPPRGYEWRQVDGNYVLAAVATGVIASAIVASSVH
jgi:Ni/Co efflux regulator RcnB